MIAFVILAAAIVIEVGAALTLRLASVGGSRWWWVAVAAGVLMIGLGSVH